MAWWDEITTSSSNSVDFLMTLRHFPPNIPPYGPVAAKGNELPATRRSWRRLIAGPAWQTLAQHRPVIDTA